MQVLFFWKAWKALDVWKTSWRSKAQRCRTIFRAVAEPMLPREMRPLKGGLRKKKHFDETFYCLSFSHQKLERDVSCINRRPKLLNVALFMPLCSCKNRTGQARKVHADKGIAFVFNQKWPLRQPRYTVQIYQDNGRIFD